MLTQKQKDLLLFIHRRIQAQDVVPSFEEIREEIGLKSKSGVHRLITALVERGYLERLPHRARALEVKKLPPGYEYALAGTSNISPFTGQAPDLTDIPLYGKIAAGTPIEAIRHEGQSIPVSPGMLGRGDYYALTVEGDSMVNAGIHNADTAIIRKADRAENGDIVVALIDGEEATLKRFRAANGTVELIPENDAYEVRVLSPDRVAIQGLLSTLIRNYH